jgi:hypothetical protein
VNQRAADRLYATISAQAEDAALADALDVEDSFRGSHAMLCLHVWLVLHRQESGGRITGLSLPGGVRLVTWTRTGCHHNVKSANPRGALSLAHSPPPLHKLLHKPSA